jgi:hypothetical protein
VVVTSIESAEDDIPAPAAPPEHKRQRLGRLAQHNQAYAATF